MPDFIRKFIFILLCFLLSTNAIRAQDSPVDSIKVYGNCNMCKANIEGALKEKDGVLSKNWNKDSKMLLVTFDSSKIAIQQIGEKIAGAGYDNQYAKATNAAYFNLPLCCQYKRE